MTSPADLRARAEDLAAPLPGLLVAAERLATAVQPGLHGRRRSGTGETFWQYRAAQPQDGLRGIDWRRSARGDDLFARQHEWQVAQSLYLWVDGGPGMAFASQGDVTKGRRSVELALALAILADRGGERVALAGSGQPGRGAAQIGRMADQLTSGSARPIPDAATLTAHGRVVCLSDFFSDLDPLRAFVGAAADRGLRGALCQVLDPAEAAFPFRGRAIFEDMTGDMQHETLRADGLRARYLDRLAERQAELTDLAARVGWQVVTHRTDAPASDALLWLYRALEAGRS